MLSTRLQLTLLLVIVFLLNYVETTIAAWARDKYGLGLDLSYSFAYATHWLESDFRFEYQDVTNWISVYGYSISYFFLFPALGLAMAWVLAQRADISAYRVFSLAIAIDYAATLPFFLFFPVPERWSYPEAAATLLSDQWSTNLIEKLRPVSGLDNCFPSFHVSLTTLLIVTAHIFQVRLRMFVTALGLTIILSTYTLGIHWLADILGGAALGVLSVSLAVRLDKALSGPANGSMSGAFKLPA